MRKFATLAAAAVLTFAAGQAFAEGESNGDPASFSAERTVARGQAFVADTSAEAYPVSTGNAAHGSSLAQLEPAPGSEGMLQTASSLPNPRTATTAVAQARQVRPAG